ncbi:MAG: hypothetical protein DCC65_07635 [Planctomycetota bacterium]|nr:MAG: hypothetical protein DCC65_07635 [Planctomycetota bacterium]
MRKILMTLSIGLLLSSTAGAAIVDVGNSTAPWLGFMNVFELPSNGGGYVFGSPWAVGDLVATFDDGNDKLTLSPNSIGDSNPFWYIGGGGPGAAGNKIMEANLYQEYTDVYNGQTLTFQGSVLSNTFTSAHSASIFIRDFASDYSSFNQTIVPLTAGPFSISLATDPGAGRHVQFGFQVVGVNVWITDVEPYGNAMITTIPEPATLALLGFGALAMIRRRRHA